MANRYMLTHARLRERLRYNPDDGWFYRFKKLPQRWERTGSPHKLGYIRVSLDWNEYLAHILAWFYMTGEWPKGDVHHKNHDKADNRWVNLEDLTREQHAATKRMMRTNTTGFTGIFHHKGSTGWSAIYRNKHLGVFPTKEEAHEAYLKAKRIAQPRHTATGSTED